MRKRIVAGNWKSNGTAASCRELALAVKAAGDFGVIDVVVCPPAVYLPLVSTIVEGSGVHVGAQNLSAYPQGAYTGEVCADMLADVGCKYVLVGHSERRALQGEGGALLAAKIGAAVAGGLQPIFCVGETLDQREAGLDQAVLTDQLVGVLPGLGGAVAEHLSIAYEPVWAIGTGRTATPDQAQAAHAWIRAELERMFPGRGQSIPLLYGGSVTAAGAAALFECPDIDGVLVGGASLKANEFLEICRCAVVAASLHPECS